VPGGVAPQAIPQQSQLQAVHFQGQVQQGMGHPNMYQYPFIPQGFPQQPAVPQQQVLSHESGAALQVQAHDVTPAVPQQVAAAVEVADGAKAVAKS
jgi:hypothetical protein